MEINAYQLLQNMQNLIVLGLDPDKCLDGNPFLFLHYVLKPEVFFVIVIYRLLHDVVSNN